MKYNRISTNHELGTMWEKQSDCILKYLSVDTEECHKIKQFWYQGEDLNQKPELETLLSFRM
jgi:hypothetical protein